MVDQPTNLPVAVVGSPLESMPMNEISTTPSICTVATQFDLPDGADVDRFVDLLVKLFMSGAKNDGFFSGEMIPPERSQHGRWQLIERFQSGEQARQWQQSQLRQELLEQFATLMNGTDLKIVDRLSADGAGEVATAIVTYVRPGMEEKYFDWEARIQATQAKFPGYRGVYLQPPSKEKQRLWATLLKFDSPASLANWFACDERNRLLKEAQQFVESKTIQRISDAFPGWIPIDPKGNAPPSWKTGLLVLLAIYPVVILEIKLLTPHLTALPVVLSTLVNLIGSVAMTSFLTMPFLVRTFRWWLFPDEGQSAQATWKGVGILLTALAAEVVALLYI